MTSLALALLLSQPAPVPPPAVAPPIARAEVGPGYVRILEGDTETWRVPCPDARDARVLGDRLFVAAGKDGLYVYGLSAGAPPQPLAKRYPGREIVKLLERDGAVVAIEQRALPAEPPAGAAPAEARPAAPAVRGKVLRLENGDAVVDVGRTAGLSPGMKLKIFDPTPRPDPEKPVVAEVASVLSNEATVSLGRGDFAEPGFTAVSTDEGLSESILMPRAAAHSERAWSQLFGGFGAGARRNQTGLLGGLALGYSRVDGNLRLGAHAEPALAFVGGSVPRHPVALLLDAGFSSTFFDVGLGLGYYYDAPQRISVLAGCTQTGCTSTVDSQAMSGFAVAPSLRLGPLDGPNVRGDIVVAASGNPGLRLFKMEADIPLSRRIGVYGSTGLGAPLWGFLIGGARVWVRGAGAPGSLGVTLGVGAAGSDDANVAVLLLQGGVELRL